MRGLAGGVGKRRPAMHHEVAGSPAGTERVCAPGTNHAVTGEDALHPERESVVLRVQHDPEGIARRGDAARRRARSEAGNCDRGGTWRMGRESKGGNVEVVRPLMSDALECSGRRGPAAVQHEHHRASDRRRPRPETQYGRRGVCCQRNAPRPDEPPRRGGAQQMLSMGSITRPTGDSGRHDQPPPDVAHGATDAPRVRRSRDRAHRSLRRA